MEPVYSKMEPVYSIMEYVYFILHNGASVYIL